jgi:hypothetical protein
MITINERKSTMNITFEPMSQPAKLVVEQAIMANGKQIGVIKTVSGSEAYTYHAVFNSQEIWSIYQGFGKTIDEAMRDAIVIGKARRQKELAELDKLENVIWGDHELHE